MSEDHPSDAAPQPAEEAGAQPKRPRWLAAIAEWSTLAETRAARRAIVGDKRAYARLVDRAQQRIDAAEALWREGARIDAFAALERACDDLRELAAAQPAIAERMGPLAALERSESYLPQQDTLPADARKAFSRQALAAQRMVARARPAARSIVAMALALVGRWAMVAMVLAFAWSVRDGLAPRRLAARASSTWGLQYAPPFAVDRDRKTNWLLQDGVLGWLQVSFTPAKVRVLRIWQPQAMPMYAVNRIRVEYMLGRRVVRTQTLDIRSMIASPQPVRIPVVGEPLLDSIKIHIEELGAGGGGFAEVEIE